MSIEVGQQTVKNLSDFNEIVITEFLIKHFFSRYTFNVVYISGIGTTMYIKSLTWGRFFIKLFYLSFY